MGVHTPIQPSPNIQHVRSSHTYHTYHTHRMPPRKAKAPQDREARIAAYDAAVEEYKALFAAAKTLAKSGGAVGEPRVAALTGLRDVIEKVIKAATAKRVGSGSGRLKGDSWPVFEKTLTTVKENAEEGYLPGEKEEKEKQDKAKTIQAALARITAQMTSSRKHGASEPPPGRPKSSGQDEGLGSDDDLNDDEGGRKRRKPPSAESRIQQAAQKKFDNDVKDLFRGKSRSLLQQTKVLCFDPGPDRSPLLAPVIAILPHKQFPEG
jgi:hypothetical protein